MNFFTSFFDWSLIEWGTLALFVLLFVVQTLFYFLLYRKPYIYAKQAPNSENYLPDTQLPSVSVIIASKNESENVRRHLPAILSQDYPDFEVIVVNMGSTDDTDMELSALKQTHTNLYYTYLPENAEPNNEKKLALTLGVKAAKKDVLLFTDADCRPLSDKWIHAMARLFVPSKDIVLGYTAFDIDKDVRMKRFIKFDNLWTAIRYFSMAIVKRPFMGVGKNLAYRKELFFREKGFSGSLNLEHGEDDLFINKVANATNTAVALSPESTIVSNVVERFHTWRAIQSPYIFNQQFYRGSDNFLRNSELFSRYAFHVVGLLLIVWGFIRGYYLLCGIALLFFVVRCLFRYRIINKNGRIFRTKPFLWRLPIYDLIQPVYRAQFRSYARRKSGKRK